MLDYEITVLLGGKAFLVSHVYDLKQPLMFVPHREFIGTAIVCSRHKPYYQVKKLNLWSRHSKYSHVKNFWKKN